MLHYATLQLLTSPTSAPERKAEPVEKGNLRERSTALRMHSRVFQLLHGRLVLMPISSLPRRLLHQLLLVTRHFPTSSDSICIPCIQNPRDRANRLKRVVRPRRLHAVECHRAVLSKRHDLVVTKFVRLPGLAVGAAQHLVDGGRVHGREVITGEDHDWVRGEEGGEARRRMHKGLPMRGVRGRRLRL